MAVVVAEWDDMPSEKRMVGMKPKGGKRAVIEAGLCLTRLCSKNRL